MLRAIHLPCFVVLLTGCVELFDELPESARIRPDVATPDAAIPDAAQSTDAARDGSQLDAQPSDAQSSDADPDACVPTPEQCNQLDDDCDGITDEDDLSDPRAEPCTPDISNNCTPGPEQCNGIDDDCDKAIDEATGGAPLARDCYAGPLGTRDIGACHAGRQTCAAGRFGPCQGATLPTPETCVADRDCRLCNNADDDCDGRVDEDLARPCGPEFAQGICQPGSETCAAGLWQGCNDAIEATPEICDGLDNDCDSATDEDTGDCECNPGDERDCYSGPPATADTGRCLSGRQSCTAAGTYGPCQGEVTPIGERCNGIDDDCDATLDEALGGDACQQGQGICATAGTTVCHPDGRIACDAEPAAPRAETCNALDDDCDGRTDEGLGLGAACVEGIGLCAAPGVRICDGRGGLRCGADPLPAAAEQCNDADDDCDGRTDEAAGGAPLSLVCYDPPAGEPGVGLCTAGVATCVGGVFGACLGDTGPIAEQCNTLDDDCDGAIDENLGATCACQPGEERACYAGPAATEGIGRCRAGEQICAAGSDGNAYGACVGEVRPTDEQCNAIDDDCDARIDEGGFGACNTGVGACQRQGTLRCVAGATRCDAMPGNPANEACNGIDDDCDGSIDEGGFGPCAAGLGACERAGTLRCVARALTCDATPGRSGAESCNGIDDDCDGTVDDLPAGICFRGDGACRAQGAERCVAGVPQCDAQALDPRVEACNGIDDDCDRTADEDPDALCLDPPGATATCRDRTCHLTCREGFFDADDDPATGCERGCDGRLEPRLVDGVPASGKAAALAVAGLPSGQVGLLYLGADGTARFSLDGGRAIPLVFGRLAPIDGVALIAAGGGFVAMAYGPFGEGNAVHVIDLDIGDAGAVPGAGGPVANTATPPILVPGPALSENEVMAIFADGGRLFAVPRGQPAAPPVGLAAAGRDWVGSSALAAVALAGQRVIVGLANPGGRPELRAYNLDTNALLTAPLGVAGLPSAFAAGTDGDRALIAIALPTGLMLAALEARGDGIGPLAAIDSALQPDAVFFGPAGPALTGRDAGPGGGEGSDGIIALVDLVAGEMPALLGEVSVVPAPVTQLKGSGASLVWLDGIRNVYISSSPCR